MVAMSLADWRRDELGQKPNDLEVTQDGPYTVTRPVYREKPEHTLIVIGWPGQRRAYLDMTREAAIWRFQQDEADLTIQGFTDIVHHYVHEIAFVDTFGVTNLWETGDEIRRQSEEREEPVGEAIGFHPGQAELAHDETLNGQGERLQQPDE